MDGLSKGVSWEEVPLASTDFDKHNKLRFTELVVLYQA